MLQLETARSALIKIANPIGKISVAKRSLRTQGAGAGKRAKADLMLIDWDFDGVLNANMVDGRFFWADHMQTDLGIDPAGLAKALFASGEMRRIVRGEADLLDWLAVWLTDTNGPVDAANLLKYWLAKDAHLDRQVLGWLQSTPARHVIATNNERHRAAYIADEMGLGAVVEHIFASGNMKLAKPDPAFFRAISAWAGLPPQECLLIDDAPENIASAAALGWRVFHFTAASRAQLPHILPR